MFKRIIAIAFIFICTMVAWKILSGVMVSRTEDAHYAMSDAVGGLWGTEHAQEAPNVRIEWVVEKKEPMTEEEKMAYIMEKQIEENQRAKRLGREPRKVEVSDEEFIKLIKEEHQDDLALSGSDINVDLDLEHRKKGLLWFSTYTVDFSADYRIENPVDHPVKAAFVAPFPSCPNSAVYDNMMITAQGADDLKYHTEQDRMVASFTMEPASSQVVNFSYQSRGLDKWTYRFGEDARMIRNFNLVMTTNFDAIDFPRDSISPDTKEELPDGQEGWVLSWNKESLVSAFQIGMLMPHRINPGPLASDMSSHAPVSLLFFFFLIFLIQVMRGIKMHPMNYFFLAAAFFAFNLLFAYLVDHVDIKLSFATASLVSIFLVVSYLRLVVGTRFALLEAGLAQFIYQILFSFAHFFERYTGLAITVGAIITLAVVMRMTAKTDWERKFKEKDWGILPRRKRQAAAAGEAPGV